MTPPCEFCAYYAALESAEAPLSDADRAYASMALILSGQPADATPELAEVSS